MAPLQGVAAGLRILPSTARPFAAAQAAWRFYSNPRITLPQLARPMIDAQPARPCGSRTASRPASRRAPCSATTMVAPIAKAIRICSQWVCSHSPLAATIPRVWTLCGRRPGSRSAG